MIIYTASDQNYADCVLDHLDPLRENFPIRLYRHNCVKVTTENGTIYVKDMRIFRNVKFEDLVIIDNSVLSFAFQLECGIPILPYYNNPEDIEFTFLRDYLISCRHCNDLREQNTKIFKLLNLLDAAKFDDKNSISETEEEGIPDPKENNKNQEYLQDNTSKKDEKNESETLQRTLNKPVRRNSQFHTRLVETLNLKK